MELFDPRKITLTKYVFYTGKGGVGKTDYYALLDPPIRN